MLTITNFELGSGLMSSQAPVIPMRMKNTRKNEETF